MNADDVRKLLRTKVDEVGTIREAAARFNVGADYLNAQLGGSLPIGPRVARKLGLKRVITYEPDETGSK